MIHQFKYLCLVILFCLSHITHAQQVVSLEDIVSGWVTSPDTVLRYENIKIDKSSLDRFSESRELNVFLGINNYLEAEYPQHVKKDEAGRILINKRIVFSNIEGDDLYFKKLNIAELIFEQSENGAVVELDSCEFDKITFRHYDSDRILMFQNSIKGVITLWESEQRNIWIKQNVINYITIRTKAEFLDFTDNYDIKYKDMLAAEDGLTTMGDADQWEYATYPDRIVLNGEIPQKTIKWGDFILLSNRKQLFVEGQISKLNFDGNYFDGFTLLDGIIRDIHINRNTLNYLMIPENIEFDYIKMGPNKFIHGLTFQKRLAEKVFTIDWESIENSLLVRGVTEIDTLSMFYHPANKEVVSDKSKRDEVNRFLRALSNLYKSEGNRKDANSSYKYFKDLEQIRLKNQYQENPTFESFIEWKLIQLIKFYTDHGTSPAKAILVSFYIILGFTVVYFFFPSEWDKQSKTKLIQDFRLFIEKNEKGYIKPFLAMLGGFAISLFNAYTLSLNAFVTLGFGKIPTKGIARYICILEGVFGWFFLSIFTVALFNQVLA